MPQPRPLSPASTVIGRHTFVWGARTFVMGVINCTTDSFAGDGVGSDLEAALSRGMRMVRDGADILDIGAESTRPGFQPVETEVELERVVPLVERLVREVDVPLSIDTSKPAVARAALSAGASMVNDVNGLRGEPELAAVIAEVGAAAVIMHNQRNRPHRDLIGDVQAGLGASMEIAKAAGIPSGQLIIDPGFGFGWQPGQNLEMIRRLGELRTLGRPILIGTSRKSTIGYVLDLPVEERLEGTAATVALAVANGADIVRVHDVREMGRVARMADAIVRGWEREDPQGSVSE